jgi:hypothetical protein
VGKIDRFYNLHVANIPTLRYLQLNSPIMFLTN